MGSIHRFVGHEGDLNWERQETVSYGEAEGAKAASMKWIIGWFEETAYVAMRYVQIEPGGWSSLEQHDHDHSVFVLRGQGKVRHGDAETDIAYRDVVYIPPNELHQFISTGDEPLGFLCVIPNKRLVQQLKALGISPGEGWQRERDDT